MNTKLLKKLRNLSTERVFIQCLSDDPSRVVIAVNNKDNLIGFYITGMSYYREKEFVAGNLSLYHEGSVYNNYTKMDLFAKHYPCDITQECIDTLYKVRNEWILRMVSQIRLNRRIKEEKKKSAIVNKIIAKKNKQLRKL